VLDLLEVDGEAIAKLALDDRKARLEQLVGHERGVIRYSDHVLGSGREFFQLACKHGLEEIVSKRRDNLASNIRPDL
jgi:bifunctional non-homologous end joining protein LigD